MSVAPIVAALAITTCTSRQRDARSPKKGECDRTTLAVCLDEDLCFACCRNVAGRSKELQVHVAVGMVSSTESRNDMDGDCAICQLSWLGIVAMVVGLRCACDLEKQWMPGLPHSDNHFVMPNHNVFSADARSADTRRVIGESCLIEIQILPGDSQRRAPPPRRTLRADRPFLNLSNCCL